MKRQTYFWLILGLVIDGIAAGRYIIFLQSRISAQTNLYRFVGLQTDREYDAWAVETALAQALPVGIRLLDVQH